MRAIVALAALSGCSLIAIEPLPPSYSGQTEPRCDISQAPIVVDLLSGALDAIAIGAIIVNYSSISEADSALIGTSLDALVSFGSAIAGIRWTGECARARRAWDEKAMAVAPVGGGTLHDPSDSPFKTWSYWCQADNTCVADLARCRAPCREVADVFCVYYLDDSSERFSCTTSRGACLDRRENIRGRDLGECVAQRARLERPPQTGTVAPKETKPEPRGFFCATSPTVADAGLCVREKDACKTAREAALAAVGDLTECALVEAAWCSGDRCAPTREACVARQQRAGSGAPECTETK